MTVTIISSVSHVAFVCFLLKHYVIYACLTHVVNIFPTHYFQFVNTMNIGIDREFLTVIAAIFASVLEF